MGLQQEIYNNRVVFECDKLQLLHCLTPNKDFLKRIFTFLLSSTITPIEKRMNIKGQTKGEKKNNREEKRDE